MNEAVYTIGHSNHAIEKFIAFLKMHEITALCDVRSQPYSRFNPQFRREALENALGDAGTAYVFLGKELGGWSDDESCYRNGQVQYDALARTDFFKQGIERIKQGMALYRIALMCAEKEPLDCHRTILIARALSEEEIPVRHILADGQIETHEQALERLIAKFGLQESDMFRPKDSLAGEAYTRRASEIAYRKTD